ncbi:UNVERIFIED_CONTAM: hypothetical protein HDU68_008449 [Siphonaria sp. JEL0065]|nr:hypothetical protein HDU68_008449 [Siphonaria sp. JEL0065]
MSPQLTHQNRHMKSSHAPHNINQASLPSSLITPPLSDASSSVSSSSSSSTSSASTSSLDTISQVHESDSEDLKPLSSLLFSIQTKQQQTIPIQQQNQDHVESHKKRRSVSFVLDNQVSHQNHHHQPHHHHNHNHNHQHDQSRSSFDIAPKSCVKRDTKRLSIDVSLLLQSNSIVSDESRDHTEVNQIQMEDWLVVCARVWIVKYEKMGCVVGSGAKNISEDDDDIPLGLQQPNKMNKEDGAGAEPTYDAWEVADEESIVNSEHTSKEVEEAEDEDEGNSVVVKFQISRSTTPLSTVLDLLKSKINDVLNRKKEEIAKTFITRILIPTKKKRWVNLNMTDEIDWRIRVGEVCGKEELNLFVDVC